MLSRKSSILATYSSFITSSLPGSSKTSSSKRKREGTRQCQHCCNAWTPEISIVRNDGPWKSTIRQYATLTSPRADQHEDQRPPPWPKPVSGQTAPTPYQIFEMQHNAVYTKARFYRLVKLYHPDRASTHKTIDGMPNTIKMERYRLIVAAHDILSDPKKRSAYDRFGAGWNGRAGIRNADGTEGPMGPFSQNPTSDPADPIWKNATWEDWERFYAARAGAKGETAGVHRPHHTGLYLHNSYFLVMVMILALIGSSANYSRAQTEGQYFVDQRDIVHDRAAKELRRARQEALATGNKNDRVQWFLRNREATMGMPGSDLETLREERLDRMLPDREVCRSGEVTEKDDG